MQDGRSRARRRGTWGRLAAVVLVLAPGALLGACGDDGGLTASSSTTGSSTSSTTRPATTSTAGATTTTAHPTTTTGPKAGALRLQPGRLGPLHVGMTQAAATATGLIGPFEPGCELSSPPPQAARLLAPLDGFVEVQDGVVTTIAVGAGAPTAPGGVRTGDPLDSARAAFEAAGYEVSIDESTAEVFGDWFVSVTDGGTAVYGFGAGAEAPHELGLVYTPDLLACE
jgi:hypothetical protein